MKKIGIFYGSSTGTCEDLAYRIAEKTGVDKSCIYSADKVSAESALQFDVLIIGTSTWGDGELQDDWYDGVKVLESQDLSGKLVALFGCGDSDSYPDTFCDGMGILYSDLKKTGCTFIGNHVSTDGYNFTSSISVEDGEFIGLALDEVNESDRTDDRMDEWVNELKKHL